MGPGFFSSLKSRGLKLNAFAAGLVLLGGVVATVLHLMFDVPLPVVLGVYSGAVTNTPSLAAGTGILAELGMPESMLALPGSAYAVAYPFGICGILLSMWFIRRLFKIDVNEEAEAFEKVSGTGKESLYTINVAIRNPNIDGLALQDVPGLNDGELVCSRLKRGGRTGCPQRQYISGDGGYSPPGWQSAEIAECPPYSRRRGARVPDHQGDGAQNFPGGGNQ